MTLTREEQLELLTKAKKGDELAFIELHNFMEDYATAMILKNKFYLNGYTIEDIKQEMMLAFFMSYQQFDPDKHSGKFSSFAIQMMKWEWSKKIQLSNTDNRKANSNALSTDYTYSTQEGETTLENYLKELHYEDNVDEKLEIEEMAQIYGPVQRKIIDGVLNGLNISEIAKKEGLPRNVVKLARERMKKIRNAKVNHDKIKEKWVC